MKLKTLFSKSGLNCIQFKNNELLWQGKEGFWSDTAPVLFPICGFLKDGYFIHQNKKYKMPVHGICSLFDFNNEGSSSFTLRSSEETKKFYPFDFKFTVHYEFKESILKITFETENTGNVPLPYSVGWHPGFNTKPGSFIQFNKDSFSRRKVSKDGLIGESEPFNIPNGKLALDENTFTNGGIVIENHQSDVSLVTPEYKIDFKIDEFPHLVLWGQPGANFVCIEPWYGMGDPVDHNHQLSEKESLLLLAPGENKKLSLSLIFND